MKCLHQWCEGVGARFCYHCGLTEDEAAAQDREVVKRGRPLKVSKEAPVTRETPTVRVPAPPEDHPGAREKARITRAAREQRNRLAALRRLDDVDQWDNFIRWLERA